MPRRSHEESCAASVASGAVDDWSTRAVDGAATANAARIGGKNRLEVFLAPYL
jgi:hypothetical protein